MIDFSTIEYLKEGNDRQQLAYQELKEAHIFSDLEKYAPLLAGTIPIAIDLPESDLDIICHCKNHEKFSTLLIKLYGDKKNFTIHTFKNEIACTVASFHLTSFEVEIFAQDRVTHQQNAYKHMLIEYQLLEKYGVDFKNDIIRLKSEGLKTEPAFAKVLGINGDPYKGLLNYKIDK